MRSPKRGPRLRRDRLRRVHLLAIPVKRSNLSNVKQCAHLVGRDRRGAHRDCYIALLTSELGHERRCGLFPAMSGLPPIAR